MLQDFGCMRLRTWFVLQWPGLPAEFLLLHGHLQEVNWYKERYRSWFIDDSVQGDGSLYLCTPVDPLFLALPLLEASRQQVSCSVLYFNDAEK
jgi:hypothetical protein